MHFQRTTKKPNTFTTTGMCKTKTQKNDHKENICVRGELETSPVDSKK